MRSEKYKQVLAICESNAADFQDKMNDALARVANPEIVFDNTRSFTAYVTYNVRKDVPETVLELLEMVSGENHDCEECPYFTKSNDKRKKWGSCSIEGGKTRPESRACEHFYVWKLKKLEVIADEYKQLPFTVNN